MTRFVERLAAAIASRGVAAYVVGGAVRDRLLGRSILDDVDVTVPVGARALGEALAGEIDARLVVLDSQRDQVRLMPRRPGSGDPRWVDLTSHPAGLRKDLERRDFTINALAAPIDRWMDAEPDSALIDPLGGRADLDGRLLRQASPGALAADPVRMVRAARLSGQLGFEIEGETAKAIRSGASLVESASPERIRDELFAIMARRGAADCIRVLDRLGVLGRIIPELLEGKGVEQPRQHYWDVFDHNVYTVAAAEAILSVETRALDPLIRAVPGQEQVDAYFSQVVANGQTRGTLLKLAALLHDVGKPASKTVEPDGRIRFFGHAERGAEMAAGILKRLRCSRGAAAHVSLMVRSHLRPGQLGNGGAPPTDRAVFRYYRDLGDVAIDTLYLNLADYRAARGPLAAPEEWAAYCRVIGDILDRRGFEERGDSRPRLLLDGHAIQRLFGLSPGPRIGRLLQILQEAEAEGRVENEAEARDLLRSFIGQQRASRGSGE